MSEWWEYDAWPSATGEWVGGPKRGPSPYDHMDHHVDLGAGRLPKGRIGIDRYPAPGVAVLADLDRLEVYATPIEPGGEPVELAEPIVGLLPFPDSSIKSIISHHAMEHIGDGFLPLMDEVYRVLEPGGIFRVITPLFPSWSAACDPDHRRYFLADIDGRSTWDVFCGTPGPDDDPQSCWLASFSVPYTKARFEKVDQDMTPPVPVLDQWTSRDDRELRVALRAVK